MDIFDFFGGCLSDWIFFHWLSTRAGCMFGVFLLITCVIAGFLIFKGYDYRVILGTLLGLNLLWLVIVQRISE